MKIKKYSKVHQSLSYYVRIRRLPEGRGFGVYFYDLGKTIPLKCLLSL
jgi:hypothetical protein